MSRNLTHWRSALIASAVFASFANASADEPPKPGGHEYNPRVVTASPDASKAMQAFRIPKGLTLDLFASEPLMANPVVVGFVEKGRVFVVETFRLKHGVTDTRGHMNWLDDDLACRSVEDRVAKYRKYLGEQFESYGVEHDRLRLVEDTNGDGKADKATVFADGFNRIPDGIAAGVLARNGDVYFTCIPDLWLLRDTNGDGKADVRKSLQYGYGVHTGFIGHDLHGLRFGPDGKLYFSIGDRGLNVTSADRKVFLPDAGAVLRCNPDGTELELFATGLRNPQELAFDEFGNLFTVDNNSDSGDRARVVYLMEGSDSGWTMGWQYIEQPTARGPWNAEKLWHPKFDGQAAEIVPPVANLSDGPSGLTYNPGVTLLPDRYKNHFFLADFRGAASTSGVRAFSVKPDGAGFALGESEEFLWGILATDVDFGPDGALYVSDWVQGWELTGKGRIYKLFDKSAPGASAAREVKALLAEGFDKRSIADLIKLLGHADQRVRQEAQFALADRGPAAISALRGAIGSFHAEKPPNPDRLTRIHAIWAIGQIGRKTPKEAEVGVDHMNDLLGDADPEVRAQAAKTLGDLRSGPYRSTLLNTIANDPSPRVRSLAAIAVGKLGTHENAVAPLLKLLRENADTDPFLRHAAVMGLAGAAEIPALLRAATDPSSSVRLGVLLALRRHKSPELARFLNDAEPRLVSEAARAIYDAPVDAALPKLAALADRSGLSEPALRRVINANARVGNVSALARVAARADVPEKVRVEAVELLAEAPKPPVRDKVTGLWRPREARSSDEASAALGKVAGDLLKGSSDRVRLAVLRAAGPLPLATASPAIHAVVTDGRYAATSRAEALRALDRLGDPKLSEAVSLALADRQRTVRIEAQRLLAKLKPEQAMDVLASVLERGSVAEKQAAFATLGTIKLAAVDDVLAQWLDRDRRGAVAPELELDLLEAARARKSPKLDAALNSINAARPSDDPLAAYRETLVGGTAERGERIVAEKAEVQCIRCHKVKGQGGEVGPDLAGIGGRHDRRYLLESIVLPNRQIAQGFETLLVSTADGRVQSGIVKEATDKELRLITAEGKSITIPKSEIEEQKRGASAMPEDLIKNLSKSELRDLIEFLATLK